MQAVFLVLFCLFLMVDFDGTDLFLRFDPLLGVVIPLAAGAVIPTLLPALGVLASALWGRAFCGFVCPMGTTLDLVGMLVRRKRPPLGDPVPRTLKYILLAIVLAAALCRTNLAFWAAPIPLVTRLYGLVLEPLGLDALDAALTGTLNHAGTLLDPQGILRYWQPQLKAFHTAGFVALFWIGLAALERIRPRFWCRYLCPAGALQALVARWGFRRRVSTACTGCGHCAGRCPMGIDPARPGMAECLTCGICTKACPAGNLRFMCRLPSPHPPEARPAPGSSRSPVPGNPAPGMASRSSAPGSCGNPVSPSPAPGSPGTPLVSGSPGPGSPGTPSPVSDSPSGTDSCAASGSPVSGVAASPDPASGSCGTPVSRNPASMASRTPGPRAAASCEPDRQALRAPSGLPSDLPSDLPSGLPSGTAAGSRRVSLDELMGRPARVRRVDPLTRAGLAARAAGTIPAGGVQLPSRRAFMGAAAGGVLLALGMRAEIPVREAQAGFVRPPGSLPEAEFLARCVRCGECMKVCPTGGLQPAGAEAGFTGLFSPVLIPRLGPCQPDCAVCGTACPSRAIMSLPLSEKRWARIGIASIDRKTCLAWAENRRCMVCKENCPYGAVSIVPRDDHSVAVPLIDESRCWGCGFCERNCPKSPSAVSVSPRGALRLSSPRFHHAASGAGLNFAPRTPDPLPADPPGFLK